MIWQYQRILSQCCTCQQHQCQSCSVLNKIIFIDQQIIHWHLIFHLNISIITNQWILRYFRLFEGNSFSSHVSIINVSLLCWCFICECCFRCGVWRFLITIQTDNVKSQSIENSCSWQWLCCGDFFSAHGILFMMGARVVWDSCLVWCPF